ncbi:hypothetical protein, partial [Bacteroides sp. 519]|uniref:hypothetical protein n=1 Tax=Bacteroides sp. 519 TaxID=2302937 RepID=UPI00194033C7
TTLFLTIDTLILFYLHYCRQWENRKKSSEHDWAMPGAELSRAYSPSLRVINNQNGLANLIVSLLNPFKVPCFFIYS